MTEKYKLVFSSEALKVYEKHFKDNLQLEKSFKKTRDLLMHDPFYPSLHSHKVDTIHNKDVWISQITGDWRIAWIFDTEINVAIILCLEIGTHSGKNKLYKTKSS